MNDILFGQETEREEGFKINDLKGATWCFRKLKAIADKETEIKAVADEERQRIDTWEKEELTQYEDNKEYFEGLLKTYYIEQKVNDKKFKLSTPFGKATARKSKKWTYQEEELIKFLEDTDKDAVRIKKELDKKYIKDKYKDGIDMETGEILPFVEIVEEENISIKAE